MTHPLWGEDKGEGEVIYKLGCKPFGELSDTKELMYPFNSLHPLTKISLAIKKEFCLIIQKR